MTITQMPHPAGTSTIFIALLLVEILEPSHPPGSLL